MAAEDAKSAFVKQKVAELSELVGRLQREEITATEAVMAAYGIGHADAMASYEQSMKLIGDKLGVKL